VVPYAPRYANGHISATGDPIHFIFGSGVGFSESADRMALFPVTSNPSWQRAAILDNFELPYLCNGSFDPLRLYSAHHAVIFAIAQLSCFHKDIIDILQSWILADRLVSTLAVSGGLLMKGLNLLLVASNSVRGGSCRDDVTGIRWCSDMLPDESTADHS